MYMYYNMILYPNVIKLSEVLTFMFLFFKIIKFIYFIRNNTHTYDKFFDKLS